MAKTCRDIVTRALRKLSRVAAGEEPDGNDMVDGLEELQSVYDEWVGQGLFGRMNPVIVTDATYTAREQDLINCQRDGGVTVTLPTSIDPSTYDCYPLAYTFGNWNANDYGFGGWPSGPRPPVDGACVKVNDLYSSTVQTWIYDSDTARWVEIGTLSLNDNAPLSGRYSRGLVNILASSLAAEFSIPVPQEVAAGASRGLYAITHRFDGQRRAVVTEWL